jgi:hypothetical protein
MSLEGRVAVLEAKVERSRTSGRDRILVVLNGSERPREFAAAPGERTWKDSLLEDLKAAGVAKPAGSDGAIKLAALGSLVLRVK